MAKTKTKKLSAAVITEALNINIPKTVTLTVGDGETAVQIPVRTRLSLQERASMQRSILSMVFMEDDDGDVAYCPAFKQFAFDFAIVNYFTDVVLPTDGEKAAAFLTNTALGHRIAEVLEPGYISDIIGEAFELIELRKQTMAHRSKLDLLLDSIIDVVQTIQAKTDGADFSQIAEFIQNNAPELKGELEQLVQSHKADTTSAL